MSFDQALYSLLDTRTYQDHRIDDLLDEDPDGMSPTTVLQLISTVLLDASRRFAIR